MRRLHLAVHVPLRKRCHEDFAAMPAVPGGRSCDSCQTVVHDLSAMTRGEASRFVAARAGEPACYRYLARRDGTLVFAPEPARPAMPAIAAIPAAVALGLAACTPWGPPQQPGTEIPDDIPAAYDDPPVIIPRATPDPPRPDDADRDAPMPVAKDEPPAVHEPRAPLRKPGADPAFLYKQDDPEEYVGWAE